MYKSQQVCIFSATWLCITHHKIFNIFLAQNFPTKTVATDQTPTTLQAPATTRQGCEDARTHKQQLNNIRKQPNSTSDGKRARRTWVAQDDNTWRQPQAPASIQISNNNSQF